MKDGESQVADVRSATEMKIAHAVEFSAHPIVGIAISAAVMLALAFIVNAFNVPNPNMVLISGLVVCSALFGYPGGITGGFIMMAYTLVFFSTDHDFVTFTDQNMQKVVVSAIGIVITAVFVSSLRHAVTRSFRQLEQLNERLEEDNRLLEDASAVDTLTGTRNRFGLRRDFPGYLKKNVQVMMVDIDDFKTMNDTFGHATGDVALNGIGTCLVELFGQDYVYRYGGDEFLVICPDLSEEEFVRKVDLLVQRIDAIILKGCDTPIRFSAGYVYGTPSAQSELRLMIRQADGNLYKSKRAGKNQVAGCAFSRAEAESVERRQTNVTKRLIDVD